jgi:hypothetical protein
MPQQSKAQKKTVSRVMHEFKHGELPQGRRGKKVKSRKQAIAIALREAGASKYQSPKKNKENLRKTRSNERRGRTGQARTEDKSSPSRRSGRRANGVTRAALLQEARRRGISGRSAMSKAQLQRALRRKPQAQRTRKTRR